jgi:DNA-binding CsgD family transcriptional regulator
MELMTLNDGKKVSLELADSVNQACKPLFDFLNIHGFTFQRMYKDGRRLYLSSSPTWINNFFDKSYFLVSGYKKFNQLRTVTLWRDWPNKDDSYHLLMKDAEENFNYGQGMIVVLSHDDYMDVVNLRGFPKDLKVNDLYLNEYESIMKFIDYFLIKCAPLLHTVKNKGIFKIPEEIVHNQNLGKEQRDLEERKNAFLNTIDNELRSVPPQLFIDGISFTPRESQCLLHMIRGDKSDAISSILGISPRTVEQFSSIIRHKTGQSSIISVIRKVLNEEINESVISNFLFSKGTAT